MKLGEMIEELADHLEVYGPEIEILADDCGALAQPRIFELSYVTNFSSDDESVALVITPEKRKAKQLDS